MPNPMFRRVNWAISTSTQCVPRLSDFTTKQVGAPQTVLRLTEKGEPRRTAGSGFWPVMFCKNPAHHVLVDIHAESQSYLLSNSRTTPGRVTSFKFKDGIDPFLGRSLRYPADVRAGRKTACGTLVSSAGDGNAAGSTVLGACHIAASETGA